MTVLEYLQKKGLIPYADSAGGEQEEGVSEGIKTDHTDHTENQMD